MMFAFSTLFFILSTLSVTPFYLLMLIAPRSTLTRGAMRSLWPVALPALVHVVFIVVIIIFARPDVLGLWRALYIEHGLLGSTTVQFIAQVYGNNPEFAILHGWVHVLVGDLFIARWAYWDAIERNVPSWQIALSSILICLVGPIGVIVYLGLRTIRARI